MLVDLLVRSFVFFFFIFIYCSYDRVRVKTYANFCAKKLSLSLNVMFVFIYIMLLFDKKISFTHAHTSRMHELFFTLVKAQVIFIIHRIKSKCVCMLYACMRLMLIFSRSCKNSANFNCIRIIKKL